MIQNFLSSLSGKKILIMPHLSADVDAIASAAALQMALSKEYEVSIGLLSKPNRDAQEIINKFDISFIEEPFLNDYSGLIIVDANSYEMLGFSEKDISEFKGSIFVIDHHKVTKPISNITDFSLIDESSLSSTVLIYKLFRNEGIKIDDFISTMVILGILFDTEKLMVGNKETFGILYEMLQISSKSYNELFNLVNTNESIDKKISSLKSAKRISINRVGNIIIVTSIVNSHEASSATNLVKIGADIAFVAGCDWNDESIVRISARVKTIVSEENNFSVANVLTELANAMKGNSGGHDCAAGFQVKTSDIDGLLKKCVKISFANLLKFNPNFTLKTYDN